MSVHSPTVVLAVAGLLLVLAGASAWFFSRWVKQSESRKERATIALLLVLIAGVSVMLPWWAALLLSLLVSACVAGDLLRKRGMFGK